MKNIKPGLNVALVVGGTPQEIEDAKKTANDVGMVLRKLGHYTTTLLFDRDFEKILRKSNVDVAYIIDASYIGEGAPNKNLRKILGSYGIPYTGSSLKAAEITKNKVESKKYFVSAGLDTPKYVEFNIDYIEKEHYVSLSKLHPPYIVKPRDGGASMGVYLLLIYWL